MSTGEKWTAAALVVLLVLGLFAWIDSSNRFHEACVKAGGTPVWDGRQSQCLKEPTK